MKKKILKIHEDYKKNFIKYKKKFKIKLFKFFKIIKKNYLKVIDNLLKKENRKKYLTISGILIIINFLLINSYISYGYYKNEDKLSILQAVVGDMKLNLYDHVLQVFLEDVDAQGNGNGSYYLSPGIPANGYSYSGYHCLNNSALIYDEETKMTKVTSDKKEACSVYFDVIGNIHLSIKIMLEDDINSNNYRVSDMIPAYGYKYSHYECLNNSILKYNSEMHSVKLSSSNAEQCNVYFTKESSDISVILYIEETYQSGDYVERLSIPANVLYVLNKSKSACTNNNERLEANITYTDGYINIKEVDIASCAVYLDKYEE